MYREVSMRWASLTVSALMGVSILAASGPDVQDRLTAALIASHGLEEDLEVLSDSIGGRPTGSDTNMRAVAWAETRLRDAGLTVHRESFTMPVRWLERSARALVRSGDVSFAPRVAAMPFSARTTPEGATAPLLDAGRGTEADFGRLGPTAAGAFLLVEQDVLRDIEGLFREYIDTAAIEQRAAAAAAAGVVYMASRAPGILYRHNVAIGPANTRPMLVMERESALRAMRLLRGGRALTLTATLDLETGGPYEAENVVADITGAERPNEVVLMGAHLDSWDLGGGTLDNGANVALLIDLARQIHRLGLKPARTLRFVLWNGEEQGMLGSWAYVRAHRADLDEIVMAGSVDTGCGRITGWITGGRPDVHALLDRLVSGSSNLGSIENSDDAEGGTDHFDFLLEGVPSLVANQDPATYGPNYHAASDQFEQCDLAEQRRNAARVGQLVWALGNDTTRLPRQTREQIQAVVDRTELGSEMKAFGEYEDWISGRRGREQ
jgi:hypothetical protein